MANGGPVPPACPECEEKIILNGGSAGAILTGNIELLKETCSTIYRAVEKHHTGHPFANVTRLVELANELEDEALEMQRKIIAFQKAVLQELGFQGPWPMSMLE